MKNPESLSTAAFGDRHNWGDQGNGTYRNPILDADYPDVDIEEHDGVYTMIASSMHYAPGMTLLQSRDLVNWELVGHVFDRLTWHPRYQWDRMAGYRWGVWAGDLACHDGMWYCYFIDFQHGLYVSTAENVRGPWSGPQCLLQCRHWTDPAVFWDEEQHQAYLICNTGRDPEPEAPAGNRIRLFRMSWDGLRLEDDGIPIYTGTGAEAAKIYRIDGTYYIFLAEWIGQDRKQLVLRSPSLYGPFERKVVMEAGGGVQRSCCQGALVRAPDGNWWFSHQLVQDREKRPDGTMGGATGKSYGGRPQHLVPVHWEDGWPIPGIDATGNGIGNTVLQARKPIRGFGPKTPRTDDDFDTPELAPQWQWNHNPRDSHWSLTERPGWLRLRAGIPVNDGGFWNAANTLSQRLMGRGHGVAAARFDIAGAAPGQRAGFCHHSGQYVLLGIRVDESGARHLEMDHNGHVTPGPAVDAEILYVRTLVDGPEACFQYGTDGQTWHDFGEPFRLRFGRWKGDRLGFYCWNDRQDAGRLDIDWFRYRW